MLQTISPKKYDRKLEYSYTAGVYITQELLKYKPELIQRVFVATNTAQQQGIEVIEKDCKIKGVHIERADNLLLKLSGSEDCSAVGVFSKFENPIIKDTNHVILINPSDMGNLGTIIRSMAAFELYDLAIIKPAADIFDPKVIRASAGTFFQLRFSFFESVQDYCNHFANKLYLFSSQARLSLINTTFTKPYGLVFGNEVRGIPREDMKLGDAVKIAHSSKVESLNLGVSAGIVFNHLYNK